jgi:hypothetical protein
LDAGRLFGGESVDDKVEKNEKVEKDVKAENDGKTEKDKPKFDWVTERSSCTLPKIFKALLLQVEADVKTRNALRPNNSPYEFSVAEKGSDFTVLVVAKDARKSVVFSLAEHAILVRDDIGEQMFEVTLTFNDKGECKLHVGNEEKELWHVRRMALENLMFAGY